MSEPLLNVMKIMLLCGLYLFFLRVLWSVFSELRDPRTVARKRDKHRKAAVAAAAASAPRRQPAAAGSMPAAAGSMPAAAASPPAAAAASMPPGSRLPAPAPVSPASAPVYAAAGAASTMAVEPNAAGQLMILDPPELAGHRFALGNEITLGRAHTNGIVLDDTYVSTVHARIFLTNGTYFIEDLASRNGSMINDRQLVATTPLSPGDRLQLGATAMEFS